MSVFVDLTADKGYAMFLTFTYPGDIRTASVRGTIYDSTGERVGSFTQRLMTYDALEDRSTTELFISAATLDDIGNTAAVYGIELQSPGSPPNLLLKGNLSINALW